MALWGAWPKQNHMGVDKMDEEIVDEQTPIPTSTPMSVDEAIRAEIDALKARIEALESASALYGENLAIAKSGMPSLPWK